MAMLPASLKCARTLPPLTTSTSLTTKAPSPMMTHWTSRDAAMMDAEPSSPLARISVYCEEKMNENQKNPDSAKTTLTFFSREGSASGK
jgi:hypothetical protein